MHHFSLVDLKAFCAVADEGNLTRGAARVHLSPSSVCSRIKGLESSLGVALLARTAQGMSVTPAGEIVRQGAQSIARDIIFWLMVWPAFCERIPTSRYRIGAVPRVKWWPPLPKTALTSESALT